MANQVLLELRGIFITHSPGDACTLLGIVGEQVRLEPVLHLKKMFDSPKKVISLRQIVQFTVADQVPVRKTSDTDERVWCPEPFVIAAVRKLERLCNKLDLPNTTLTKFYIEAASAYLILVNELF